MKKIILLFTLFLGVLNAHASNYFSLRTDITTPVNDTLRISPYLVGTFCPMFVTANFEGYLDHWDVQLTYPSDMYIYDESIESGSDMTLPYTRINGTDTVHEVLLTTHYKDLSDGNGSLISYFSATSNVFGYWDSNNDGYYEQYGTVKWATGFYDDMFSFLLYIPSGSTVGSISIKCDLTCTTDWRGVPTINLYNISKTLYFYVGFLRGDANGDDVVNINDVTTITEWLEDGLDGVNPYKILAADMDGNGVITVHDVTVLIDYLLQMNG